MRKIKEVLRLRNELKLDQRQIARSCSISVSTVHEYLKRAAAANLSWPLPDDWDDAHLEAALFPSPGASPQPPTGKAAPDFAAIHEQLQRHRHVTLQLVWEEYRDANPDGYRYSRFCELYQRWRRKLDVVLRQEHKAGEKAFVDWAGSTMPIHDRDTGNVWQASLFVAALGASSYTWAEVTRDQQMESWLLAHVHALEHWGGVPLLVIPDNTRTGVSKSCRYDPDVNPTYHNFAVHYGFGVLPARPYKPRDKAVVENAVQVAQRWILAALRQRKFFSLTDAVRPPRHIVSYVETGFDLRRVCQIHGALLSSKLHFDLNIVKLESSVLQLQNTALPLMPTDVVFDRTDEPAIGAQSHDEFHTAGSLLRRVRANQRRDISSQVVANKPDLGCFTFHSTHRPLPAEAARKSLSSGPEISGQTPQ